MLFHENPHVWVSIEDFYFWSHMKNSEVSFLVSILVIKGEKKTAFEMLLGRNCFLSLIKLQSD